MKKSVLLIASALAVVACDGFAQAQADRPAFEVASIKPAPPITPELLRSGQAHLGMTVNKARAEFGNVSLTDLIARAYRVKPFQISGPDWLASARFEIAAKLPEGASAEAVPEMLQGLLEERFKLKVRRDSKEFPVYALVVDKGGAKLTARPADFDPASKDELRPIKLEAYASLLSGVMDRPVLNFTELNGEYMLSMMAVMRIQMTKMRGRMVEQAAAASGLGPSDAAPESAESEVAALVKSLGLKLEARKAPMPLVVIEHVEKNPTEN